ncbi:SOS response-associated peptidase [Massilia endophytica]|uniref:SOS response-associated peptidase n=1 Tax=Massilia endophytica TaxID=2899220 RepID=UPI001E5EBAB0|nr:SOS response-associated peptidase [Massilia endophytica]UGQ49193.1 SOS response-associated peptidase [Massilia endophytica]
MCGRFDQNDISRMLDDFGWVDEILRRGQAEPCWNVAPTMRRAILFVEGAALVMDDKYWGYRPQWALAKGLPIANHARRDKLLKGYWSGLLKRGRVIVPADGWYEWTGPRNDRQPWHIHRQDRRPLYMAGVACFGPEGAEPASTGFALVTDDAQGGLLDVHGRRPVVFTAEDAATWLDPATPPELAEQLARELALGPEAFEWYRVGRAVNSSRNQGEQLALRLED